MSFSSLTGEGSTGGEGSIAGEGSLGGAGLTGTGADAASFSGALITTHEGIVGFWTPPTENKPGDGPIDTGKQMRRWEARVRAHVLDFELLSSFRLEVPYNQGIAKLLVGAEPTPLVQLTRPSAKMLRSKQLQHVYDHADLRRDRAAEVLTQIKGIEIFLGRGSPVHPERHQRTLELLDAFFRALVSVEMRIKHALAVPRPMEFSSQIMPMIQTPGHGSFPAGHAAESFMLATVLSELMQAGGRYADWDATLARLAARISVNRVIAGVHFPVDLAAGLTLGLTVGRYFIALARGGGAKLPSYEFNGEAYADKNFPLPEIHWDNILKPAETLPKAVATHNRDTVTLKALTKEMRARSPLCWLWDEAVKEWQ